jgi:hypothetical protein
MRVTGGFRRLADNALDETERNLAARNSPACNADDVAARIDSDESRPRVDRI